MVFVDALGIDNDGGDALLRYAKMVFAGFGPENDFFRSAMSHASRVLPWIERKCQREALRPGSFGAQIYDAADAGEIALEDAPLLVRSFLAAGLDTTMSALGTMIHCLVVNPEQWELLKHNSPALIRPTFDEVLRYDPPVWALFRTALEDTEYAGTTIRKHETPLLLVASANRDESRWSNPERFEITRKTSGHIGFGTGIHACVGQMVARLEGEAILSALSRQVKSIKLPGDPIRRLSTGLRAFSSVPVSVSAHGRCQERAVVAPVNKVEVIAPTFSISAASLMCLVRSELSNMTAVATPQGIGVMSVNTRVSSVRSRAAPESRALAFGRFCQRPSPALTRLGSRPEFD
jgi:4-methoxybenzoate monooxygenase (O-demethylating)